MEKNAGESGLYIIQASAQILLERLRIHGEGARPRFNQQPKAGLVL